MRDTLQKPLPYGRGSVRWVDVEANPAPARAAFVIPNESEGSVFIEMEATSRFLAALGMTAFAVRCPLPTAYRPLSTVHCLLPTAYCPLTNA